MTNTTLTVPEDEVLEAHGDILVIDDGRRFIVLHIAGDLTILLGAFEAACVAQARALAAAASAVADKLEAEIAAAPVQAPPAEEIVL